MIVIEVCPADMVETFEIVGDWTVGEDPPPPPPPPLGVEPPEGVGVGVGTGFDEAAEVVTEIGEDLLDSFAELVLS